MCHTNTPPPPPSSSDLTKSDSLNPLPTPHRKNRTKTRRPKFLSLRLQLSSNPSDPMTHHQQLNLFPLHPENLIHHDKDIMHDDHNIAFLFTSHGPATLNGLLQHDSPTTTSTVSEDDSMSPPCLTADPFDGDGDGGRSLVRKAMKRRNEEEEERWVCYSEVTSYSSAGTAESAAATTASIGLLSLKLDYEGILNAWSDKGPLYLPGDSDTPQAVPDFLDHVLPHHPPHVESEKKVGQREASVLRYKEKRQSRLFSKRIRYEVRKLNAHQRPRMKGRFVKRD